MFIIINAIILIIVIDVFGLENVTLEEILAI